MLAYYAFICMRLSKVRLAGFKSFVDVTTFVLAGNLNGIVGPNGCGKSNIIDAVRWVMGESSAKQLRGESMTDVIFNGSVGRKPSGQATIELIFDNSDGSLGGQWSTYAEISIKRILGRDGQSSYFLNGTKCRRKDITEIFLGTGLGPRSYAIIEQGMISRVIESRPEELRSFFEEAAGISKYKERRKETEIRIEHTRENLSRLADVRSELGVQYNNLEKQAKIALRYQSLKSEERILKMHYLAQQLACMDANNADISENKDDLHKELEQNIKNYNTLVDDLFSFENTRSKVNTSLDECNTQYHRQKEDSIRLEGEIKTQQSLHMREQQTVQESQLRLEILHQQLLDEQQQLDLYAEDNIGLSLKVEAAESELINHESISTELEDQHKHLQQDYQELQKKVNDEQRQRDLIKNSIEHQETRQLEQARILARIKLQLDQPETDVNQLTILEDEKIIAEAQIEDLFQAQLQFEELKLSTYTQLNNVKTQSDKLQREHSKNLGQLQALETLQASLEGNFKNADKDSDQDSKQDSTQDVATKLIVKPLHSCISTDSHWQRAVEASLKHWLMIPVVLNAEPQLFYAQDSALAQGGFSGLTHAEFKEDDLGYYVQSRLGLGTILGHIKVAASLEDAQQLIQSLEPHQWIVLEDGMLIGKDWLLPFDESDLQAGIIARVQAIAALKQQLELDDVMLDELYLSIDKHTHDLENVENKLKSIQVDIGIKQDMRHKLVHQIGLLIQSNNHAKTERERINQEVTEIEHVILSLQDQISENRAELEEILIGLELSEIAKEELFDQKNTQELQLQNVNNTLKTTQQTWLNASKQLDSLKVNQNAKNMALMRMRNEITQLNEKINEKYVTEITQEHINALEEQLLFLSQQLDELDNQRNSIAANLAELVLTISKQEQEKQSIEEIMIVLREKLQKIDLSQAQLTAQRSYLDNELADLRKTMSEDELVIQENQGNENHANVEISKHQLDDLSDKIQKIGAVNLMAIEECKALELRKNYLDEQDQDLNEALIMLENAIKNIDKETRGRFLDTFEKVNASFKTLFPTLFGGGEAWLEMSTGDALSSGVNIIARPPGKRPGTIHLLSGGEKTLTSVALVFAIFNLNPAPFCMLDEVDAPLDEANVGRYGALLRKMSATVQFIFITHNKGAMAVADHLIGVTMSEPGVSRLVSVDMEAALAFID